MMQALNVPLPVFTLAHTRTHTHALPIQTLPPQTHSDRTRLSHVPKWTLSRCAGTEERPVSATNASSRFDTERLVFCLQEFPFLTQTLPLSFKSSLGTIIRFWETQDVGVVRLRAAALSLIKY